MKLNSILVILMALLAIGCQKRENITPENPAKTSDSSHLSRNNNFFFPKDYEPGKLIKLTYLGREIQVEQRTDGYRIEGDIRLTDEQFNLLKTGGNANGRAAMAEVTRLWPGGVVPFVIDPATNNNDRNRINWAIAACMNTTSIVFVPWSGQADYIAFTPHTENSSPVGRAGGRQELRFEVDGWFEGTIIHEIGHALGLFHEHTREDADGHITINWSNIKPGKQHNFFSYNNAPYGIAGFDLGTFDFNSIMLYDSQITDTSFVYNPNIPTITRKDGSTYTSNPFDLSAGDIETINYLYNNLYTKVYARVEYTNIQRVDLGWEITERGDAYLRFYSDPAFTTPTAPNTGIVFTYYQLQESIPSQGSGGRSYTFSNIQAPASTTQIFLGNHIFYTEYPFEGPFGPERDVYKLTYIMSKGIYYTDQYTQFFY